MNPGAASERQHPELRKQVAKDVEQLLASKRTDNGFLDVMLSGVTSGASKEAATYVTVFVALLRLGGPFVGVPHYFFARPLFVILSHAVGQIVRARRVEGRDRSTIDL
jgi:hypothetical protein